jgi:hypothetical protein
MSPVRVVKMISKYETKRKKEFRKISETTEGFCFVIFIIGFIRPNKGRGDDINSCINASITPNA